MLLVGIRDFFQENKCSTLKYLIGQILLFLNVISIKLFKKNYNLYLANYSQLKLKHLKNIFFNWKKKLKLI